MENTTEVEGQTHQLNLASKSIIGLLHNLQKCFIDAGHRYNAQFRMKEVGFVDSWVNSWTAFWQDVAGSADGMEVEIKALAKIPTDNNGDLLQAMLDILKSDKFIDSRVGGKSICRHLVDCILESGCLLDFIDDQFKASTDENETRVGDPSRRKLLFKLYGYKLDCVKLTEDEKSKYQNKEKLLGWNIRSLVDGMKEEFKDDRTVFRKFFRDYLIAILETWQQKAPREEPKASVHARAKR